MENLVLILKSLKEAGYSPAEAAEFIATYEKLGGIKNGKLSPEASPKKSRTKRGDTRSAKPAKTKESSEYEQINSLFNEVIEKIGDVNKRADKLAADIKSSGL